MRTLVCVTRVGVAYGVLPTVDRVRWWAKVASQVAAKTMPPHVEWVWRTAPQHRDLVQTLAPDRVHVVDETDVQVPSIVGEKFLVARLDADDALYPSAWDALSDASQTIGPDGAVVFWCGRQINLVDGRGWCLDYRGHWTPPYLALAQDGRDKMLDVGGQHTSATKGRKVHDVAEPSWLQLVGPWNAENTPDKFGRNDGWPISQILKEADMAHETLAFDGELDELAARFGTDKGSAPGRGLSPKRYVGAFYQPALEPVRDQPVRLLELGVHGGASIRTWLEFLPNAKVAGVDVRPAPGNLTDHPRYRHFQGDQTDMGLLTSAVEWLGGLGCWIDDASHRTVDHIASHAILWPLLASGGWAALEDLHASPASVPWLKELGAEFLADGRLAVLHKP
jgi:hypothetical protein